MGWFDFLKNKLTGNEDAILLSRIIDEGIAELKSKGLHIWSMQINDYAAYNTLLELPEKQKVIFIVEAGKKINAFYSKRSSYSSEDRDFWEVSLADRFMQQLLKSKMVLDDEDIQTLTWFFTQHHRSSYNRHILYWPVGSWVTQIEKQLKERPVTDTIKTCLTELKVALSKDNSNYYEKERIKLVEKVDTMLFQSTNSEQSVKPTYFPVEDDFGRFANEAIRGMPAEEQNHWFRLTALALKASGGKPSKKFLDESKQLFKELGNDKFKKQVGEWVDFITQFKEKEEEQTYSYNNQRYTTTVYEFLAAPNIDVMKGFIWMLVHFHDKSTLFAVAALAERSFKKIPGKGPAAAAAGNACLYVLANSKGLDGVGHLSRLKLRIQQSNTQTLIDKYLNEAAKDQGVSVHEIEDMAVDDYGLTNGRREWEFDDYKAVLEIIAVGKTSLNWFKPDGSPQKSVPAFVKEKHAAKLKKVKDTIKQVELTLTAQRDRLDRMLKADRKLSWEQFNEFYFSHGLMSFLAKQLLWNIEVNGTTATLFYKDGSWVNNKGEQVPVTTEQALFSLWHPVLSTMNDIKEWREFMMENKIVQPLKQAFREVYLLTDAEINTRTYSNRMAAHILKQHQFNSLAKIRGWKYSLLGCYDDGRENESAQITLPDYNLRAEFWVNEVNAEDAFNDTGIWLYIATDQVRFAKADTNEVLELVDIPKVVLSEIMRDVDLFVGVASVGNDPQWQDSGGVPAHRDYWQMYAFGELNEVSKTRKTILERLVPRLKISKVAEIKDKFLVVKGKLRTYKIHIGSTNILMEPNDQYLCIVPDRSKKEMPDNVFLPFEGDNGLSVIISKAFLLADDDKITDETITRQIKAY